MPTDPRDAQIALLQSSLAQARSQVANLNRIASEYYAGLQSARAFLAAMPRSQGVVFELQRIDAALAYNSTNT